MAVLTNRAELAAERADRLARDVEGLSTLEQVVRWGLALPCESEIVEVIVQDEYCHDVVMTWEDGFVLVFDTT